MEKKWKLAQATDEKYRMMNAHAAFDKVDKQLRNDLIAALDMLEHTTKVLQIRGGASNTIDKNLDFLAQFKH